RRRPRPRGSSKRVGGDGQIRTAEWGFCRALPYHLATSPLERVVGIEPTHQPWEGRRLPLHHPRSRATLPVRARPYPVLQPRTRAFSSASSQPLGITLIARARTIAIVISEISASAPIRAFAQRLSGSTSAGLNAVA